MKNDEFAGRNYPVQEDMRWQRLEWRLQRAGEWVLIIIVLLGAAGLFSKGILSEGTVKSPDGSLSVVYERFARVQSNMNMNIRVNWPSAGHFTVVIGSGALDKLQVQTLQPQPLEAMAQGNDLRLTYSANRTADDHSVWIGLQPQTSGTVPMSVSVEGAGSVRFTQWIYP